jgi:hypothetical protein
LSTKQKRREKARPHWTVAGFHQAFERSGGAISPAERRDIWGKIMGRGRIWFAAACSAALLISTAPPPAVAAQAAAPAPAAPGPAEPPPPITAPFTAHVIARGVSGGYQPVVADINRDGRMDVISLSQRGDLMWYDNPGWTPHVILAEARAQAMIGADVWNMVNASAADVDGDGYPEIGLAYGFNANGPLSIGNIGLLKQDGKGGWTLKEIGRAPTAHRVRFSDVDGNGKKELLVAPVLNELETGGLANPHPLPVSLYIIGQDVSASSGWRQSLITRENMGLVHAVQPLDWDEDGDDEVLTAGFSGVFVHDYVDGGWRRFRLALGDTAPWPGVGASEIQIGKIAGKRFFVTIEHFHGSLVVVYTQDSEGRYQRNVIESGLTQGHALVLEDFDGDGVPEIVASGNGSRNNLYYYKAADPQGRTWTRTRIDNDMSASGCAVADMNGDKRPDLVCMDGRAPNYLKWYEHSRR